MKNKTRAERMGSYYKHKLDKHLYRNNYYIENIFNHSPKLAKLYNKSPFRCYKCDKKVSDHDHYPSCKKCYNIQINREIS